MRILVTGFEPFGKDNENASWEAVSRIPRQIAVGAKEVEILHKLLPVEFEQGGKILQQTIRDLQPDAVICVGEAGGRVDITPETTAVNSARAAIADNSGYLATGEALDTGPRVIDSRLPNEHIVNTLADAGYPVSLSHDAGQYVCNAVFRASLTHFTGPAGFIHVPAVRSQGVATVGRETDAHTSVEKVLDRQRLTFDELAQALILVCKTVAEYA